MNIGNNTPYQNQSATPQSRTQSQSSQTFDLSSYRTAPVSQNQQSNGMPELYIPPYDPDKVNDVLADEDRTKLTQEENDYYAEKFSNQNITKQEMGDLLVELEEKGVITQTERLSMCSSITPIYTNQGATFSTVFIEPCNPDTGVSYYEENKPSFPNDIFEAAYDRLHYLDQLEAFCKGERMNLYAVENSYGQSISQEREAITAMQRVLNGIMGNQSQESKNNSAQTSVSMMGSNVDPKLLELQNQLNEIIEGNADRAKLESLENEESEEEYYKALFAKVDQHIEETKEYLEENAQTQLEKRLEQERFEHGLMLELQSNSKESRAALMGEVN
ncbi:MAG: hypothetical protein R3Y07_07180 [Eubacteriales bacterium]